MQDTAGVKEQLLVTVPKVASVFNYKSLRVMETVQPFTLAL
jgi:hypothetical protein